VPPAGARGRAFPPRAGGNQTGRREASAPPLILELGTELGRTRAKAPHVPPGDEAAPPLVNVPQHQAPRRPPEATSVSSPGGLYVTAAPPEARKSRLRGPGLTVRSRAHRAHHHSLLQCMKASSWWRRMLSCTRFPNPNWGCLERFGLHRSTKIDPDIANALLKLFVLMTAAVIGGWETMMVHFLVALVFEMKVGIRVEGSIRDAHLSVRSTA